LLRVDQRLHRHQDKTACLTIEIDHH